MKWEQARFECWVKNSIMCGHSNCDAQEWGVLKAYYCMNKLLKK